MKCDYRKGRGYITGKILSMTYDYRKGQGYITACVGTDNHDWGIHLYADKNFGEPTFRLSFISGVLELELLTLTISITTPFRYSVEIRKG